MRKSSVVKIIFLVAIIGLASAIISSFIKSRQAPGWQSRLPIPSPRTTTTTLEIVANIPQVKIALDPPEDFPDINQLKELPLTISDLAPGKHIIFAFKEGYQEYIRDVEVLPNRKTRLEIIMYPEIQLVFEYFRTGPIVKSFSWLDDKTVLYQKENSLAEATYTTEKDLVQIPEGSIISWSNKGGAGAVNNDFGLFLYKYPNQLTRIGDQSSLVSISVSGNKLAFYSGNYLKLVATQDPKDQETLTSAPPQEAVREMAWSPDEQYILLATKAGNNGTQLQLIDIKNKSTRTLTTAPAENISRISFSTTGEKVVYAKEDAVVIMSLEGQIIKEVTLEEETVSASSAWLNAAELLLIEKSGELPFLDKLFLINLNDPEEKRFLVTSATIIGRLDLNFKPIVSPDGDKILLLENNGPLLAAVVVKIRP